MFNGHYLKVFWFFPRFFFSGIKKTLYWCKFVRSGNTPSTFNIRGLEAPLIFLDFGHIFQVNFLNPLRCIKGTVFFFRGHGRWSFIPSNPKIFVFFPFTKVPYFFIFADMDVGHSFIQIQKSCFFPRSGKKKYKGVFFSQKKFMSHSFRIWWVFLYFL